MKKSRMEKGITLIALIITIIILLVLAVVTIGAIKDSGIIEYAKDASSESEKAKNDEQLKLMTMEQNLEIAANPSKYSNITDVDQLFERLYEILKERYEIQPEYILKAKNLEEKDRINPEKIINDPNRFKEVDDTTLELRIPCIYNGKPIDIIVIVKISEGGDAPVFKIESFGLNLLHNISISEVGSSANIKVGGNISEITEDGVPIPKGFYYIGGTKDTGVVISNVENDSMDRTERTGKQFVWVPVLKDPQLVVKVNSTGDKIKTVQILNTDRLNETFEVNDTSFNKSYSLTNNVIYEVIVTYESGQVDDKLHIVDQAYDKQLQTFIMLKSGIEAGDADVKTFEEEVDVWVKESEEFDTRMDYLIDFLENKEKTSFDNIAEKESVLKYGGFYIGRYEEESLVNSYDEAIAKINEINEIESIKSSGLKATLPSGAAWDRIGRWFVETSKGYESVYWSSVDWGHYKDSEENSNKYYANNIYKLAGGYGEWTTEMIDGEYQLRGGSKEAWPMPSFAISHTYDSSRSSGIRPLMYIK